MEKLLTYPFNSVSFMLVVAKSFEILPKPNGYGFILNLFL